MSGQYTAGYGSPISGHRGHFTSPQHPIQQVGNTINQCGGSGAAQSNSMFSSCALITPQQHAHSSIQSTTRNILSAAQFQQHNVHTQPNQHQQMGMLSTGSNVRQMLLHQHHSPHVEMQAHNLHQLQQLQPLHHSSHQQPLVNSQVSTGNVLSMSHQNSSKEINIVALSRLGQETVQDITSRFQEIFGALKIIQPTSNRDNTTEKKVQEYFRTIRLLFKRLRIIYEKCSDGYPQGIEYSHTESSIAYKDEPEGRPENFHCDEYRKALQENQELIETVKLKNRQLREIIDRTRIIIWEINTMLSMRRS